MAWWRELLRRTLTGGVSEITGDSLARRVVDRIVRMRTRGKRGTVRLPDEVQVIIRVSGGSLQVVRSIVEDPDFDQEIAHRLENRLVDLPKTAHPLRLYRVEQGESDEIKVSEVVHPVQLALTVLDGDRHGEALRVPTSKRDLRVGRGKLHGTSDLSESNDVIVTYDAPFVSRRAARIRRLGRHLRLQALDQGDCLAVERPSGERVRPNRTIEGWAPVRPGDLIEFSDGAGQLLRLRLDEGDGEVTLAGPEFTAPRVEPVDPAEAPTERAPRHGTIVPGEN
ncbi:MAG: hypothetical protein AAGA48_15900 [Myxococcota bacterium]